jgi:hypothetical protein
MKFEREIQRILFQIKEHFPDSSSVILENQIHNVQYSVVLNGFSLLFPSGTFFAHALTLDHAGSG